MYYQTTNSTTIFDGVLFLSSVFHSNHPKKRGKENRMFKRPMVFWRKYLVYTVGNKRDHNKAILKVWKESDERAIFFSNIKIEHEKCDSLYTWTRTNCLFGCSVPPSYPTVLTRPILQTRSPAVQLFVKHTFNTHSYSCDVLFHIQIGTGTRAVNLTLSFSSSPPFLSPRGISISSSFLFY